MVARIAAQLLALLCLLLAFCLWPSQLGRWLSLDWQIGDLRPFASGAAVVAGIAALFGLLRRRAVASWLERAWQSRRHVALAAITLGLASLLALAAAELTLRVLDLPFRVEKDASEYSLAEFDPEVGWTYRPRQTVVQPFGSDARSIELAFDANGFRAPSADTPLDPTAPSLLLVGGSYAMGHGVPYAETLAGRLARAPDVPYQVINLGVQAYGTDQALLLLLRHIDRFATRVVVYPFICDHVARSSNADRRLLRPRRRFLGTKPRFRLRDDGEVELAHGATRYPARLPSHLLAFLAIRYEGYGPRPSLELVRALVGRMDREVRARGARFIAVDWDTQAPRTDCGDHPLEGLGIELIETSRAGPDGLRDWIIPGDGHPDARAHAAVAELVRATLTRAGSAPQSP